MAVKDKQYTTQAELEQAIRDQYQADLEHDPRPASERAAWKRIRRAAAGRRFAMKQHIHPVMREAFIKAYADAIRDVSGVVEFTVRDRVSYLDVRTVYRGDITTFEDQIYDAEGRVLDRFSDMRVRWNLVAEERGD